MAARRGAAAARAAGRQGPAAEAAAARRGHQPLAAGKLAAGLPAGAWQTVTWREGTAGPLASRFAAVRVRPAHDDFRLSEPRAEEWFLAEWPEGEEEPTKYWLSTLPEAATLEELVATMPSYAGGSSATSRSSSRSWASATSRAAAGAASTTTPPCASPRTPSWRPSAAAFPLRAGDPGSRPPSDPEATGPAAPPVRPERRSPAPIATLRRHLAVALLRRLPRCPCRLRAFQPHPTAHLPLARWKGLPMSGASIGQTLGLWSGELCTIQAQLQCLFGHASVAASAAAFLDGLLGPERRKTGWMRAEAAGDPGPWRQQAVLGRGRWDADALRDLVRDYALATLAVPEPCWSSTRPASSSRAPHPAGCSGSTPARRARSPTARSACSPPTCPIAATPSSIAGSTCPGAGPTSRIAGVPLTCPTACTSPPSRRSRSR